MATVAPVPEQIEAVKQRILAHIEAQGDSPPGFNIDFWLQAWFQRPNPALGGKLPAELLSTEAGIESVCRALGSVISGAYQ